MSQQLYCNCFIKRQGLPSGVGLKLRGGLILKGGLILCVAAIATCAIDHTPTDRGGDLAGIRGSNLCHFTTHPQTEVEILLIL